MSALNLPSLSRCHSSGPPGWSVGKAGVWPFWLATGLLAFAPPGALRAQSNYATPYAFTTLAGAAGSSGSADGTGSAARFNFPMGVAVDSTGNVYVADMGNNSVRKITPAGEVATLAGLPALPDLFSSRPFGVAVDSAGNVYVAESNNNRIRKITPAGVVTTVAGNSTPNPDLPRIAGFIGTFPDPSNKGYTDGPASTARFNGPQGLAVDTQGNIYVADTQNRRIRKITPGGAVTTFAGTSPFRPANVDGTGSAAWFGAPGAIAVDSADNLYVADYGLSTIRKITQAGVVTTIAGKTDTPGSADGPASEARFNNPSGVAVDSSGNVYVADQINQTIRVITPGGLVTTLAGLAGGRGREDGTGSAARFSSPSDVAVDGAGNLYVADQSNQTIRKGALDITGPPVAPAFTRQPAGQTVTDGSSVTFIAAASGTPTPTFQWRKGTANISGATSASFHLASVGPDAAGTYTVVATNSAGSVTSTAATLGVLSGRLVSQTVTSGHGMTFSAANASGSIQWQVSSDGGSTWSNLANSAPYSGATTFLLAITNASSALNGLKYRFVATDNGSVSSSAAVTLTVSPALLPFPTSIAMDSSGNLLVGDANTNTIQKISPGGVGSLVAGTNGTSGSTDGTGAGARFNQPNGLTLLTNGTIIVSDTSNAIIRSITGSGMVTTLAGSASSRGNADGAGGTATFSSPIGISRDTNGVLYVADSMNHTIRKITPDGTVSTIAGSPGVAGFTDGTGSAARFNFPSGIAVDSGGNIYVADTTNNLIRKITSAGVVTTLAGLQNVAGFDDGTGSGALFSHPGGLATDAAGNVYVADTDNSTIRKITPAGVVTTIAGLPTIAGLVDGSGLFAQFNHPLSLSVDAGGNIFVADTGNAAIRKIDLNRNVITLTLTAEVVPVSAPPPPPPAPTPTPTPAPSSGGGGGGGGGAPSLWFFAALALLGLGRRLFRTQP